MTWWENWNISSNFKSNKTMRESSSTKPKYVKNLLKRFGIDDSKIKNTPMSTTIKLDKDEKGKEVDIKMNRDMIDSLLYLTASRLYIMFSIYLCARFQSYPKESHLLAVKKIFRYLSGSIDLGFWYSRKTHKFNLLYGCWFCLLQGW